MRVCGQWELFPNVTIKGKEVATSTNIFSMLIVGGLVT